MGLVVVTKDVASITRNKTLSLAPPIFRNKARLNKAKVPITVIRTRIGVCVESAAGIE
jgi:hypothetical protein